MEVVFHLHTKILCYGAEYQCDSKKSAFSLLPDWCRVVPEMGGRMHGNRALSETNLHVYLYIQDSLIFVSVSFPFGRLVTRPTNDMLVGSAMRMTCPDDAHD